jgi:putative phosphoribosyl transferase
MITFKNRADAGRRLADELKGYVNEKNVIVLGLPRGGVPVAFEVALAINAPLEVFVSRKLGVPGQEELAFGAVSSGGIRILDPEIVRIAAISGPEIEQITAREKLELERRESTYRSGRPPLNIAGSTVILIDDGVATGSSVRAAINALRQMKPQRLVVATPVIAAATYHRLRTEVDDIVCVFMPEGFYGIGQFYDDFSQVTDEEVIDLLRRGAQQTLQSARPAQQGST